MSTATTEKTNYPVINLAVWRALRKKIQENAPKGVITPSYLSSLLNYDPKAAGSLLAQLRRVGLVNEDGRLTDRAFSWRNDSEYKAVCEEILDEVYPQELRDLFHDASAQRQNVEQWFTNNTKQGKGTASNYARFYMLLLESDPAKLDAVPSPKSNGAVNGKRSQSSSGASTQRSSRANARSSSEAPHEATQEEEPPKADSRASVSHSIIPTLHLDFQIHISADSSPEQIDSIFASMAKHLRTLASGAAE